MGTVGLKGELNKRSGLLLPDFDNVLVVQNLHTYFETFYGLAKAVRGVNLAVPRGQILGIVGETGSGKSVTALSILRLVSPPGKVVSGNVFFNSVDLLTLSEHELDGIRGKRISMIFQNPRASLNPLFTMAQQMDYVIRRHLKLAAKDRYGLAIDWLARCGLSDPKRCMGQYPHELSTGMCQRVMIAIALLTEPELLIADEPTTGVDVTLQAQILELISDLVRRLKAAAIIITHDMGVVAEATQWVGVMYAGRVVEFGPTETVLTAPRHPYTIGLLKSTLRVDEDKPIHHIPGIVPSIYALPEGCAFRTRCPWATDLCAVDPSEVQVGEFHYSFCHFAERLNSGMG